MNHNRKIVHVVLFGLVLFLIAPAIASAETDPITQCIEYYEKLGKAPEDAKRICMANVTSSP